MVCPYNRKTEQCARQYKNELVNEETGIIKGNIESYVVTFTLMECPKEGCAVWVDGKCTYNQGVNGE